MTALALAACTLITPPMKTCKASWYGRESGRVTASGTRFTGRDLTCAMRSRAFGRRLWVRRGSRTVLVVHDDFGPAAYTGRGMDVSERVSELLGFKRAGVAVVQWCLADRTATRRDIATALGRWLAGMGEADA